MPERYPPRVIQDWEIEKCLGVCQQWLYGPRTMLQVLLIHDGLLEIETELLTWGKVMYQGKPLQKIFMPQHPQLVYHDRWAITLRTQQAIECWHARLRLLLARGPDPSIITEETPILCSQKTGGGVAPIDRCHGSRERKRLYQMAGLEGRITVPSVRKTFGQRALTGNGALDLRQAKEAMRHKPGTNTARTLDMEDQHELSALEGLEHFWEKVPLPARHQWIQDQVQANPSLLDRFP